MKTGQDKQRFGRKMYVTRPLSLYRKEPSALSLPPPEGPNSGVLVIQDEDPTIFFGLLKSDRVSTLPFPQNKNLTVKYTQKHGESHHVYRNRVLFIPVINQPLSSNLYYVIKRKGDGKGKAYINSKEEDMKPCCFCYCISDLKPQPLDPHNIDHQFMIHQRNWGGFVVKPAAPDGFPPHFLRRKGWQLHTSTPKEFQLSEAAGIDKTLRARLPNFNFSSSHQKCSPPVVVGKWYCPFMFVKEGDLDDQMKTSTYYEMTLEQRWELIFCSENYEYRKGNAVNVDVSVESEVVRVGQKQAVVNGKNVVNGVMWFGRGEGGEARVGLSMAIVERMRWEEERFGWAGGGGGREERVKRVEEFGGKGDWITLGCYVLVERFALKRMDGSLVLTYDFMHPHHFRSKWE